MKTQEKANVTIMFLHFVTEFTLLFLNLEKSGHMLLKGAKLNIQTFQQKKKPREREKKKKQVSDQWQKSGFQWSKLVQVGMGVRL